VVGRGDSLTRQGGRGALRRGRRFGASALRSWFAVAGARFQWQGSTSVRGRLIRRCCCSAHLGLQVPPIGPTAKDNRVLPRRRRRVHLLIPLSPPPFIFRAWLAALGPSRTPHQINCPLGLCGSGENRFRAEDRRRIATRCCCCAEGWGWCGGGDEWLWVVG